MADIPEEGATVEVLHNHVVSLAPAALNDGQLEQHLCKSSRLVIAVRRHDRDSEHWRTQMEQLGNQHEYVWIKGRTNVTVGTVLEAYRSKCEGDTLPNVELRIGDWTPPLHLRMDDLGHVNDQTVVFTAVEHPQTASRLMPNPGHGHPVGTPSHESVFSLGQTTASRAPSYTPARQPLQEVSRQLPMAPAQESLEPARTPRDENDFPQSRVHVKPERQETPSPHDAPSKREEVDTQVNQHPVKAEENEEKDYEPRIQDQPFAPAEDDEEDVKLRGLPLQGLAKGTSAERLEAAVVTGVRVLNELQVPLQTLPENADAASWLEQIQSVRDLAVRTKTIVGVVGNTGAGKSSVINAMLDEERLVPTNCMRACTAVVTEMSYNESNNENARYRAEIEFIQPEEWKKELRVLFEEVFDDSGSVVREISNPETQAGIAYAKIRAVYHKYTKDMLSNATVDSLMRTPSVQSVLGTTRRISTSDPSDFYRRLQGYVDSKEKGTEKLDKNGNKITNPKRVFEFWPLIKVVKIYTKAEALSTGAVIVDLPGVHDSNAARAAVAESYMKQCTGLWIVAPINRAVDDKAAKQLLGNTFRRQLKYDGTYSAVTFICSKTDDISRTEATDSLELNEQMADLDAQLDAVMKKQRVFNSELKKFKSQKKECQETIDQVDDQVEIWEGLLAKLDKGKEVFAPTSKAKKRKRTPKKTARKRRRISVDSDDDDDVEYIDSETDEEASDSGSAPEDAERTPLTQEQIDEKLEEFRKVKKDTRKERENLDEQMREVKKKLAPLQEEEEALDAKQSELCIAGRNEYSRGAIQRDFADGIRELDMENAEEENPEDFDPEQDLRDYDQVARDLPVFCVSSRAYQKLQGRLKKDKDVPGFANAEQTEMPQLKQHCISLTENGRQAGCRRFLNSLTQLMTSLGLWSGDDGSGNNMTDNQRSAERRFLAQRLKELSAALEKAVKQTLQDAEATLAEQVFEKFEPAVQAASSAALPTSAGWGAKAGGLHWGTYRATVRRSGVFQGASGLRDFNSELAEPLYKQLASTWERAFQRRLPQILNSFTRTGTDLLKKFHKAIADRCRQKGHGIARIGMLENQLEAYKAIFGDLATNMIASVNEGQREINREFTPVITAALEGGYTLAAEERGTGSFMRMKGHMSAEIGRQKTSMFEDATGQVQGSLMKMCARVREEMAERANSIYTSMHRDYMTIIGGVQVGNYQMPWQERSMRRDVDDVIARADELFQKVVDADVEDLRREKAEADASAKSDDAADEEANEDDIEDSEGDNEDGSANEDAGSTTAPDDDGASPATGEASTEDQAGKDMANDGNRALECEQAEKPDSPMQDAEE